MPEAPVSWMVAVLIIFFIYSFFYFRRHPHHLLWVRRRSDHRHWVRRLLGARRSDASGDIQFHSFDLSPTNLTGLDPSDIAALPVDSFAALKLRSDGRVPSDCAVCLSPFDDGETLRFIPKCQHAFHTCCLDPWLEAHTTCPSCRATLVRAVPESTRSEAWDVVIRVDSEEIEREDGSSFRSVTLVVL